MKYIDELKAELAEHNFNLQNLLTKNKFNQDRYNRDEITFEELKKHEEIICPSIAYHREDIKYLKNKIKELSDDKN
jgi:hypothetical protein